MSVSRSAMAFMQRQGMRPTPRLPQPRLDLAALLINRIPLQRDQLDPNYLLLDGAGASAQDRGKTDVWPPSQEV